MSQMRSVITQDAKVSCNSNLKTTEFGTAGERYYIVLFMLQH